MKQKALFRWIIGGGVILVAVMTIFTLNFGENIVYFYTPQEAHAQAAELSERTIKVGALVKPGSVDWQPEKLSLAFTLYDPQGGVEIQVDHQGTPPDMFQENQGVVVEGRIAPDGQSIVSRRLMVKHSEEYIKPEDHPASVNKMLLQESMFKNESP